MWNSNKTVTMQLIIIYGRTFLLTLIVICDTSRSKSSKAWAAWQQIPLILSDLKSYSTNGSGWEREISQYRINIKRHLAGGLRCLFWFCQLGNIAKFLYDPSCKWKWCYSFRVEFRVSPIFTTVKRFPRMSACISCPCSLPFLIFYF